MRDEWKHEQTDEKWSAGDGWCHEISMVHRPGHSVVYLNLSDEWSGDTESGFGAELSVSLPIEIARALSAWLNAALTRQEPKP